MNRVCGVAVANRGSLPIGEGLTVLIDAAVRSRRGLQRTNPAWRGRGRSCRPVYRYVRQTVGVNRRAAWTSCRIKELSDRPNSDR